MALESSLSLDEVLEIAGPASIEDHTLPCTRKK